MADAQLNDQRSLEGLLGAAAVLVPAGLTDAGAYQAAGAGQKPPFWLGAGSIPLPEITEFPTTAPFVWLAQAGADI